jgi:hypothetical protein
MLIVTIAALVMAASLGWFAYRLMQEEQRRSEARVALLASALDAAPAAPSSWSSSEVPPVAAPLATPLAPLTAAREAARAVSHTGVPEVVMLDDDSRDIRRFASEVAPSRPTAAPAAVTRGSETQAPAAPVRDAVAPLDAPLHHQSATSLSFDEVRAPEGRRDGLFADVPDARPGDGRGVMAVIALLLVGVLAAGYLWFGGNEGNTSTAVSSTATTAPAAPVAAAGGVPLELLSLAHERRGNTLVVRGVVRNPVAGSTRPGLAASVLLLDEAGGFLRSGRATLSTAALAPGVETPFAVELPSTSDVRRYRVTFRGADGALVPHADKRQ